LGSVRSAKKTVKRVDVQRLFELGLLSARAPLVSPHPTLLSLCAQGVLQGGLSVDLDVRPDELVGPLCQRLGGEALKLRILEVRTSPAELWVLRDKKESRWPVPDVPSLVRALNRAYRRVPTVRDIAVLGEWEDAWQLWCLEKDRLPALLKEGLLEAETVEVSALGAD
jgi:hypothetical protein